MTSWFHVECMFENLKRGRSDHERIGDTDDVDGFESLNPQDKKRLEELIGEEEDLKNELAEAEVTYLTNTQGHFPTHLTSLQSYFQFLRSIYFAEVILRLKFMLFSVDDRWTVVLNICLVSGDNFKFWQIGVSSNHTVTQYGEIGTTGFSLTKEFDDDDAAEAYAETNIAKKLKGGYVKSSQVQIEQLLKTKEDQKSAAAAASDSEPEETLPDTFETRFVVEYAKTGRSKCKDSKCADQVIVQVSNSTHRNIITFESCWSHLALPILAKGDVRFGKSVPNPYSDKPGAEMMTWYHVEW